MQERAGTRAFLHAAHAAAVGYRAVVTTSEDAYEFVLRLFLLHVYVVCNAIGLCCGIFLCQTRQS